MKKIYLFLIGMLCCFPIWAETIHVPSPGDLREALTDADFNGTQLKITGTLNGADLAAIHAADGRLANVTELDLSEVSLVASDDCYATYKTDAYDCYLEYSSFYYSETCKRDSSHYSTMLGTGVTEIAVYSNNLAGLFAGNTTYKKVVLPKSLGKIGFAMFQESEVSDVVLPSALTEIEERAFESTKLSEITLPATCKTIDDYAFLSSALTHIDLENITKLGKKSFAWSKLQGDITLGAVSEVPDECFMGCNLSSVKFSKGLKRIGYEAFYNNKNLQSLNLPDGLEYIGASSFVGCGIQTMNAPKSITYVGVSAFPESCNKSLEMVDGVCYIGQVAYDYSNDTSDMTSLRFKDGTVSLSENLGVTKNGPKKSLVFLEVPSSVKVIGNVGNNVIGVFENYVNLETAVLPDGLETMGNATFKGCKSLKKVNIPNSLQKIEEYTFFECESLENVTFSPNLRYIGRSAFCGAGLTSLTLGENIESVENEAFKECQHLFTIRIETPSPQNMHISCPAVEKIIFGPKVTYVASGLASGCSSLLRVVFEEEENNTIPLTIGANAFSDCSSLKLTSIPSRLVEVGDYAFNGIREISSLYLGQNIKKIGSNAFSNIGNIKDTYCDLSEIPYGMFKESGLRKLTIGNHVKCIWNKAFDNNTNLTTVICESRKGINEGRGLDIYSNFNNCNITTVVFPEYDEQDTDTILYMYNSFNNNPIKELRMPDNVKVGIDEAFINCPIEKIYLGNNTWEILSNSFDGCKLQWVDIPPTTEMLDRNSFGTEYIFLHNIVYVYGRGQFKSNIVCPVEDKEYYEERTDLTVARVIGYDVEFEETNITLKPNDTQQIHAIFKPEEEIPSLPEVKFTWKSLNPDVAIVDENGIVKAIKKGQAQITVGESYKSAGYGTICNINVEEDTGVSNIQSNGNGISLKACNGELVVSGAKENSKVSIYSLGGQCVRTTTEKSISGLASGIYVVVVENQKVKVALP